VILIPNVPFRSQWTPQVLATQVGVTPFAGQATSQLPQLVTESKDASQPLWGTPSQSAKPSLQLGSHIPAAEHDVVP
jgi:hypothetical protein